MTIKDYISLFGEIPTFLYPYLNTKALKRLLHVSQFCGCDYTNIYSPTFFYSRFYHSLVVALINYQFTHDKVSTIASLLHDIKTPCFAHTIDYVLGDYEVQESSEKKMDDSFFFNQELLDLLAKDGIKLEQILDLKNYSILENKSPRLCADRLDGVLHTCAIWLHTHSLKEISEVYQNIVVLEKDGVKELGFLDEKIALKFADMVLVYARELQDNRNKFVTQYLCDLIKKAILDNLITLEDLYQKKESDIIEALAKYPSWSVFNRATNVISSEKREEDYTVSIDVKKRNVIPLVKISGNIIRFNETEIGKKIYQEIDSFHDKKYAYVRGLKL